MKRGWIVLAASLFVMGGLGAEARAEKTTFLLDWIIYGKHAPFFVAQDMGFYKKVGLDVEYKRGFGSGDTIVKMGAKAAPLGFADAASLVNARANSDIQVKVVSMNHAKAMSVVAFLKEKGYKTPKDLVGARYGTPLASSTAVIFPALAGANGFNAKDVQWVEMPVAAMISSLLVGKVDFLTLFATELPTLLPKAGEMGKEVRLLYYSDWGVDTYNNGVVVHEDTIQANPQLVRNALIAFTEAWAWSLVNVDEAVKNFLKYAPGMSESIIRGHLAVAFEHLFDPGTRQHGLGYMDHQKMDYTVEILTKLQNLKKRIRTEDLYTNRFLPQWPAIKAALGDKVF